MRTTTRGLKRDVAIYVRRVGRRRARGVVLEISEISRKGRKIYVSYRDAYSGGVYLTELENVSLVARRRSPVRRPVDC